MDFDLAWEEKQASEQVVELALAELRPNPYQPRTYFDDEALANLASSIAQVGVFQPIIVRKSMIKGYEIVAGERRYRASLKAGKQTIPALVRTLNDDEMMQIAILENLQRENLKPIEEAKSYQTLMQTLNLTQQEVADRLGKSRPYIANYLRLLQLPATIQQQVDDELLSVTQARPLISIDDPSVQEQIAHLIIQNDLSVREVEDYVKQIKQQKQVKVVAKTKENIFYAEIARQLTEKFGTIVNIVGENEGRVEFRFLSTEELTHLLDQWDIQID